MRASFPRRDRADGCLSGRDRAVVRAVGRVRAAVARRAVRREPGCDSAGRFGGGARSRGSGEIPASFRGSAHWGRIRIRTQRRRGSTVREPGLDGVLPASAEPVGRSQESRVRRPVASPDLSKSLSEAVKVLFASGSEDLIPTAIEHMQALCQELPLVVVSEFPPENARWIPFPLSRSLRDTLAMCRWHFRGNRVRLSAVILQPHMPYWRMRLIGFLISPWNFIAFNENFGHFMLRPRSVGTILRHTLWRTRNFFVWEFSPGGVAYTFLWRLVYPWAVRLPFLLLVAGRAGGWARWLEMFCVCSRVAGGAG